MTSCTCGLHITSGGRAGIVSSPPLACPKHRLTMTGTLKAGIDQTDPEAKQVAYGSA